MLGACACGKTYVGQDINETHVKESNEIIQKFDLNATVIQKTYSKALVRTIVYSLAVHTI